MQPPIPYTTKIINIIRNHHPFQKKQKAKTKEQKINIYICVCVCMYIKVVLKAPRQNPRFWQAWRWRLGCRGSGQEGDGPLKAPLRDPLKAPLRDPLRAPFRDPLRDPSRDQDPFKGFSKDSFQGSCKGGSFFGFGAMLHV